MRWESVAVNLRSEEESGTVDENKVAYDFSEGDGDEGDEDVGPHES